MRSPLRLLAALGATATLVVSMAGSATATADGPTYGAPAVGECHALTMAQAGGASDPTAPVACTATHTTRVIGIGRLPDSIGWDTSAATLQRVATRLCEPRSDAALGATVRVRDRSAYSWLWFTPTADQQSHGARWISCETTLLGGQRLLPLPTDAEPAITGTTLGKNVARCLLATTHATTTCARTHVWRATGAFTMTQSSYPGAAVVDRTADTRCASRTSSRNYYWTYHTKTSWELGHRVVVCYTKTSA